MIEIIESNYFAAWYDKLDGSTQGCIQDRLWQIANGNFGDHKSVGYGISELRFHFGAGLRIYYTMRSRQVILLLAGGNKSTQRRDIEKAKQIANEEM